MAFSDEPISQPQNPAPDKGQGGVRVVVDFASGRIIGAAGESRRPGHTPGPAPWRPPSGNSAA
jgi:hypothetical protein